MSDQTKSPDPGLIWRDQPEETVPVNLAGMVNRRTVCSHALGDPVQHRLGLAADRGSGLAAADCSRESAGIWTGRRRCLGDPLLVLVSPQNPVA